MIVPTPREDLGSKGTAQSVWAGVEVRDRGGDVGTEVGVLVRGKATCLWGMLLLKGLWSNQGKNVQEVVRNLGLHLPPPPRLFLGECGQPPVPSNPWAPMPSETR